VLDAGGGIKCWQVQVADGTPQNNLNYHIRINQTNENGGFFTPDSSEHWYWPVNGMLHVISSSSIWRDMLGILIDNTLYIFAYNVYADGGGPFGFAFQGTTVIRVSNPHSTTDVRACTNSS